MKQNEKIVIGLALILGIAFFIYKANVKSQIALTTTVSDDTEPLSSEQSSDAATTTAETSNPTAPAMTEAEHNTTSVGAPLKTKEDLEKAATSIKVIQQFQNEAKIELPQEFKEMTFEKIDKPGPQTLGVVGHNDLNGTSFALLSKTGPNDIRSVKDYLVDSVADSLKITITEETLSKPETINPSPDSGFSSIQAWVVNENGHMAIISYATKSDNSGTCLSILSGETEILEKNEHIYDDALKKIKSK